MTADARNYSDLKQTADELWAEGAPVADTLAAAPIPQLRITCTNAGRYTAGAIVSAKYQLVEVLGEGGMGSVWIARNRTLEVDVALKLMRSELADEAEGIAERMLQEARAAACIGHPAIIQVYDFGFTEQGDPFIVMELLRGESLAQALSRRRRVTPIRAVQTLLPIIDALAATHAQGIVHRDLKPANIFLARPAGQRLQPKVLDFGVAKLEQRAAGRLTRDGAVVGSPAYMSPEQFRGDTNIDGRADIWALCVVLYEMVSGHRPFDGEPNQGSVWWNVLNGEPRPISEHGLDEAALWGILEKGFVKDPAGRYPDMRALGRALAEWLQTQGVGEDICDASLRGWLNLAETGVQPVVSFFPSREPGPREPPPQKIVIDPLGQTVKHAIEGSGTRRIPQSMRALRVRSAQPERRLLWLSAAGAALAFLSAASVAAWYAAPAVSRPNVPEATIGSSHPSVASIPSVASVSSPALAEQIVRSLESSRSEARPVRESSTPPIARQRRQPAVAPKRKAGELKNPFD